MRNKIEIREHPSNLCIAAKLVWEDRFTLKHVYSVKGGYVACPAFGIAYEGLFASEAEARTYMEQNK